MVDVTVSRLSCVFKNVDVGKEGYAKIVVDVLVSRLSRVIRLVVDVTVSRLSCVLRLVDVGKDGYAKIVVGVMVSRLSRVLRLVDGGMQWYAQIVVDVTVLIPVDGGKERYAKTPLKKSSIVVMRNCCIYLQCEITTPLLELCRH